MCSGSAPNERAMVGSAVASTVPSSCSMNIALATISAIVRALAGAREAALRRPGARRAAEPESNRLATALREIVGRDTPGRIPRRARGEKRSIRMAAKRVRISRRNHDAGLTAH